MKKVASPVHKPIAQVLFPKTHRYLIGRSAFCMFSILTRRNIKNTVLKRQDLISKFCCFIKDNPKGEVGRFFFNSDCMAVKNIMTTGTVWWGPCLDSH